ncbi:MAG: gfo/Idh/MocA family oxidoreductase, partial [Planctomycetia bacterium]|nr:gfo/Idh/MocA family oxidoreductase [Planctomycetia bacterium]
LDAVLIAAPPHLRPPHVEAAVAARVHVMCETPAGVDARGVIRVAEAFARGRAAGLSIASGLHGRRDERLSAAVARVHAGAIGRPVAVDVHAVNGRGWRVPVRPEWTAAEARLRNWIGSDALSGGPFVERHVHAIDRALWALGDRLPSAARPLPGRAGVAIGYVFDDGAEIRVSSLPCPEPGVVGGETVSGSRGSSRLELAADGRRFQATIDAFLQSIRSGRAMDDSGTLVRASLVAVMGRTAAEAGRTLGWGEVAGGDAPALALSSPVHQIGRSVNPAGA